MSYEDFTHDGVDYRLILSNHASVRKEPIDGLDALVLETGLGDQFWAEFGIPKNKEIRGYLSKLEAEKIPLYSVDGRGKVDDHPVDYINGFIWDFLHKLIPPFLTYGVSRLVGSDDATAYNIAKGTFLGRMAAVIVPSLSSGSGGLSRFVSGINSFFGFVEQSPVVELRNALAARKIKQEVVPHVVGQNSERFRDRNPRIGILYGAAHSGIKGCIKNDWRSDLSIALHKYHGLRHILDRDASLTDVSIYRFNENSGLEWDTVKMSQELEGAEV